MSKVNEGDESAVPSTETGDELSAAEAEKRLEKVAIGGLVNIYHAITGTDCPRYLALGMATSAVAALQRERDALVLRLRRCNCPNCPDQHQVIGEGE